MQDGVCLAADTRATGGSIVGDKNCEKIHPLAPNIFCCGAGTAADCDHVTGKFEEMNDMLYQKFSHKISVRLTKFCVFGQKW